jgi:hypothetical protein
MARQHATKNLMPLTWATNPFENRRALVDDKRRVAPKIARVERKSAIRPWLWPNLLSLDAPVVSVLWLYLFAGSLGIAVHPSASVALGLLTWLIYVADRMLDSKRLHDLRMAPVRHRFCDAHRFAFGTAFAAVALLACWICATRLDLRTQELGLSLAAAIGVYFVLVHVIRPRRRWFAKEGLMAVLFGLGTYLPVASDVNNFSVGRAAALFIFVLLCWTNSVLIEYAEWSRSLRNPESDPPHSSTMIGGEHLVFVGFAIAGVTLSFAAVHGFRMERPALIAEAISAFAFVALGHGWRNLSSEKVRVIADAVLLSPLLVLPFLHG